jgi:hypothetical protein
VAVTVEADRRHLKVTPAAPLQAGGVYELIVGEGFEAWNERTLAADHKVAFGAFGALYLVSAAVLGALLLHGVLRIRREAVWTKAAWWTYKYSLLYLALLFVAMVVDRQLWS